MPEQPEINNTAFTLNVENYIVNVGDIVDDNFFKKGIEALDSNGNNLINSVSINTDFVNTNNPSISTITVSVEDGFCNSLKRTASVVVLPKGEALDENKPYIYAFNKIGYIGSCSDREFLLQGVFAYDKVDGNLTSSITIDKECIDSGYGHVENVRYSVVDKDGFTSKIMVMKI